MDRSNLVRACMFASSLILAACATPQGDAAGTRSGEAAAGSSVAPANFTKGLPAQSLQPNECGLFLWSANDISNFVFFARAGQPNVVAHIDGKTTDLAITGRAGDVFGQFFTEYKFATDDGEAVSLSYEPGQELTDGARIQSGALQYATADGWRMVVPVLGARVCQPLVAGPNSVTAGNGGR